MKRAILFAIGLLLLMAEACPAKVVHLDTHGVKHRVKGERDAAEPLPDQLVISPGRYQIGRFAYEFRPGGNRTPQGYRIAFNGARSLMSGVMWQAKQRLATDDGMSMGDMANTLMSRKLDISCGWSASLVEYLLEIQGVPARRVALVPGDELNPQVDGHTLMEVYFNDRWQTIDPDANIRPLYRGHPITAQNYPRREHAFTFDYLAGDTVRKDTFYPGMMRHMGTSAIEDGNYFYFTDPIEGHTKADLIAFRNGWYQYLSRPEFFARFYP